ncbi:MAG: hypothetical protein IPH53_22510 [Flavobacteriales bacterium]|nr:hypothetical protein [Flavobacteriales bacterium]
MAKLIILKYSPDLQSGREPVLGILFEMERLWEKFMLRLLKRDCPEGSTVSGQETTDFWEDRSIRPDIVITSAAGERTIVDTKWKMPDEGKPAMSDLQQLFAYNVQFGCDHWRAALSWDQDPFGVSMLQRRDGWRSGASALVQHGLCDAIQGKWSVEQRCELLCRSLRDPAFRVWYRSAYPMGSAHLPEPRSGSRDQSVLGGIKSNQQRTRPTNQPTNPWAPPTSRNRERYPGLIRGRTRYSFTTENTRPPVPSGAVARNV